MIGLENSCEGCSGGCSYQSKTAYETQDEDDENKYGAQY